MKKLLYLILAVSMLLAVSGCGSSAEAEPDTQEEEVEDWTREGYFTDEADNMLSVTWMDLDDDSGWYVGFMNGEDLVADSYGGMVSQDGNILQGTLTGEKADLTVTVSEEGPEGLLLTVKDGETYHFKPAEMEQASIIVTINTEGNGNIDYTEGEDAPEIDTDSPYQSAQINLAEPAEYTLCAWPNEGWHFVKWTKDGEDLSTEPQITVLLEESADYTAVFEAD